MTKIIGIAICLITLVAINYKVSSQKSNNTFASLFELKYAMAAPGESGQGPSGKTCGSDKCSVSYSIGVYTVTEEGTYYHCKTSESGTCNSSECDVKCDAL